MYKLINPSDMACYERFRYFTDECSCAISLCDEIDVTTLYDSCHRYGRSFYVSTLYAVSSMVNSRDEFKMTAVDSPEYEFPMPAVYDRVDVSHNIFRPENETYSTALTVYKNDYIEFYDNCLLDIERLKAGRISAVPWGGNVFEASCIPLRHFTSVGLSCDTYPLSPVVVWGKAEDRAGKKLMPLSIQINHACADGFHLSRFLDECEKMCSALGKRISEIPERSGTGRVSEGEE